MDKRRWKWIVGVYAAGIMLVLDVHAQNRTRIQIDPVGDRELRQTVEKNASAVITELNRAVFFDERPIFPDASITDSGREALLRRWDQAPMRCTETTVVRQLVAREEGTYEIRSIPLLVDGEDRQGVLTVTSDGRIAGLRFADEMSQQSSNNRPTTGTLVIETVPDGAIVESNVDQREIQPSPVRFRSVSPGNYTFTIRDDGYRAVTDTTFTVEAGRTTRHTVRLQAEPGSVRITDVPEGGMVRIDGTLQMLGAPVELEEGSHQIIVSRRHYEPLDTTVTVRPGQTMTVSADLERLQVPYQIQSEPSGATVRRDGRPVGTTPLQVSLDAGRSYQFVVEKDGHIPSAPISVTASAEATNTRTIDLSPIRTETSATRGRITDVHAERRDASVRLQYTLQGQEGKRYAVGLLLERPDGTTTALGADAARGDVGVGLTSGAGKMIILQRSVPEGGLLRVTLGERVDRGGAALRSVVLPGLGQFYSGETTEGWIFATLGAIGAAASVVTTLQHQRAVSNYNDFFASTFSPEALASMSTTEIEANRSELQTLYDDATSAKSIRNVAIASLGAVWAANIVSSFLGPDFTSDPVYSGSSVQIRRPSVEVATHSGTMRPQISLRVQF